MTVQYCFITFIFLSWLWYGVIFLYQILSVMMPNILYWCAHDSSFVYIYQFIHNTTVLCVIYLIIQSLCHSTKQLYLPCGGNWKWTPSPFRCPSTVYYDRNWYTPYPSPTPPSGQQKFSPLSESGYLLKWPNVRYVSNGQWATQLWLHVNLLQN